VALYAEAVDTMEKRGDATEILARCERLEKSLGDNPASILYSDSWEKERAYVQIVMEIQSNADDFIFSLAGHKGERVESLNKKTVSELMSFAERITKDG